MENVKKVANSIIECANSHGDKIDNPRLQRFLYYVEGWTLAILDQSAFQEKIAMVSWGPAVKSVYNELIPYETQSINDAKLGNGETVENDKLREIIREVYSSYREYSTTQLTGMIIALDGTPHDEKRATFSLRKPSYHYSPQKMKKYFQNLLEEDER